MIISQDRPGSSNSLTLSWLLVDEAKFIDYAKLKDETLPANGGIKSHFGKHSFNHSIMILSDMPQTQKGSWFLHYRDKMDFRFECKIPALVEDFCRYYAVNDQDFHYNVVREFERHGWRVESVYFGNPMHHHEKYLLINNAFARKQCLVLFFNRSNNEDLILTVQSAGVSNGRNGFKKDKSGEN